MYYQEKLFMKPPVTSLIKAVKSSMFIQSLQEYNTRTENLYHDIQFLILYADEFTTG